MAGPSIGTWVKVRNKSGRTTARVIAKKFGGGSYSQGEVITQSEYNSYKDKRAEGMKAEASGGGGQAKARLPKAALSKQEKTSILLKNKKRIKAEASKSPDNYSQINRMNRLEKADRASRKAENPNAPGFQRARKAADTRRKNASGGGQQKPAGRRLQKAALSKQQKADIMDRNLIQMVERDAKNRDESRIKANRLNRKKREVRRKYNSQTSAFKRARTAADTRRANARRKEEARR